MRKATAYGVCFEAHFDWAWAPAAPDNVVSTLELHIEPQGRAAVSSQRHDQPYAARKRHGLDDHVVRIDRADDGSLRVAYADGAAFVIDANASHVYGDSAGALTLEDLCVYAQGPIFGLLLRLRGVTCLHASAAVVGGRAIAIIGAGGMGKSTTAAAFARRGLPILTDDVLALEDAADGFWVQPGLPRVLLWPPSIAALWGDSEALPRVVPGWEKRYLDLRQAGYSFADEKAKLAAIYVFSERLDRDSAVEVSPLVDANALIALVANTYANDFLDTPRRAQELEVLGRLVSSVPVRRVRVPDDRSAITRACDAILADFDRLRER